MSRDLFVIEAPGKISTLRNALDKIGFSGAMLFATKGRLYDLPKGKLGVDLSSLESVLEEIRPDVVNKLRQKIEAAERVFVLTDNDHEGDLIASHVHKLIPYYKESHRVITNSLSPSSLALAINNPVEFRNDRAVGSLNRRLFDRICGYHFSQVIGAGRISIGRVLSPVLKAISSAQVKPKAVIEKNYKVKDGFLTIKVEVDACTKEKFNSVKAVVDAISVTDLKLGATSSKELKATPFTGPEALVTLSKKTGGSIKDISESLQSLYERGLISYHRTESKSLSKDAVRRIALICSEAGEHSFDASKVQTDAYRHDEHAHEGIHVTGSSFSINAEYDDLTLEDKVYRLIFKNNASLGKNIVSYESDVTMDHPAIQLLKNDGCQVDLRFGCIKDATYRTTFPLTDFPGLCPELNQGWSRLPSAADRVAEIMLELGLGRPSTFAYHCDKISRDYLNAEGELSFRGYESVQRAITVAPLVLSPERAIEVERILLNSKSVESAIYDSFYEIGIKEEFMFGKMKAGDKDVMNNISLSFD